MASWKWAWLVCLFVAFVIISMLVQRDWNEHVLPYSDKDELRYDEQGASLQGFSKQAARAGGNSPSLSADPANERHLAYGKPINDRNLTVMFLCMPKCGTRTLRMIFSRLWRINHFGAPTRIEVMLGGTTLADARREVNDKLTNAPDGSILHGHYRYLDMSGTSKKPILMSFIRDPVSRFESHFYYMRYGDTFDNQNGRNHRNVTNNETVNDCVENKLNNCNSSYFRYMYVHSFCGYDVECDSPEYALQQAKKNVDKFLVIGITEEYDLSLRVFEKLLPATFSSSLNVYAQIKEAAMTKYKTSFKKPASPQTWSHLRNWMEKEYEFYDFVKDKFYRLVRSLRIGDVE